MADQQDHAAPALNDLISGMWKYKQAAFFNMAHGVQMQRKILEREMQTIISDNRNDNQEAFDSAMNAINELMSDKPSGELYNTLKAAVKDNALPVSLEQFEKQRKTIKNLKIWISQYRWAWQQHDAHLAKINGVPN